MESGLKKQSLSECVKMVNKDISMPKSKFIKVVCPKCKNEQIIFGNASHNVKCLVCDKELAYSTGGKSKISARVKEILE